jgi:hypothetical protein
LQNADGVNTTVVTTTTTINMPNKTLPEIPVPKDKIDAAVSIPIKMGLHKGEPDGMINIAYKEEWVGECLPACRVVCMHFIISQHNNVHTAVFVRLRHSWSGHHFGVVEQIFVVLLMHLHVLPTPATSGTSTTRMASCKTCLSMVLTCLCYRCLPAGGNPILPNPAAKAIKKAETLIDAVTGAHCPTQCCTE